MASVRKIKKEIDYLVSEVVSDCYTCLYLGAKGDAKKKEKVISIIEKTVALRNELIQSANHPNEKHNPRLVRKHYQLLRSRMFDGIDEQFNALSKICKE